MQGLLSAIAVDCYTLMHIIGYSDTCCGWLADGRGSDAAGSMHPTATCCRHCTVEELATEYYSNGLKLCAGLSSMVNNYLRLRCTVELCDVKYCSGVLDEACIYGLVKYFQAGGMAC